MEEYGFRNVATGYAVIELTPDNPGCPNEFAEWIIESERQSDLEAVSRARASGSDRIIEVIDRKYDTRLNLYRKGIKQWDTQISLAMVVRGET